MTSQCGLWCGAHLQLQDCCVDLLAVAASSLFAVLLLLSARCAHLPSLSCTRVSGLLEAVRCVLVLSIGLTNLLELADALLSLLAAREAGLAEAVLLAVPLSALLLLGAAAVCSTRPRPAARVMLGAAWFASAAARLARLGHLLSARGLHVTSHARAATAAAGAAIFLLLAAAELTAFFMQRGSSAADTDEVKEGLTAAKESYQHNRACLASRATFWWLTKLLWRGAHTPLELEDLGRLPAEESTQRCYQLFKHIYTTEQLRSGPVSLWRCYARYVWPRFTLGGLFKLLGDLMGLAGPLGISGIIAYAARSQVTTQVGGEDDARIAASAATAAMSPSPSTQYYPSITEVLSNGYVLGMLVLLASLAQGTLSQAATHLVNLEGIRLKAALQALVYDKALRLAVWSFGDPLSSSSSGGSHPELSKNSDAEDEGEQPTTENTHSEEGATTHGTDAGAITNLMSEDAYNVMSCVWIGHYVWAIPLKIGVIMVLLHGKLGWSAVLGAALCVVTMTPLQLLIGKKMSSNSKAVSELSDERLRKINETLQGIKLVKLYGWEQEFCARVLDVRAHELRLLDMDSLYWGCMTFLTHASSALLTLVTLGVYQVIEDAPLTPGDVFSALALFNQLTVPLFIFPVTVPLVIGALVSTKRLEDFLALPEISTTDGPPTPEPEVHDVNQEEIEPEKVPDLQDSSDSVFGPAGLDNIHEDEEDEEEEELAPPPAAPAVPRSTPVVTVRQGSFSWRAEEAACLHVAGVTVPRGQLTLVVGPVGSGKSSLLSALLGEMHATPGAVSWESGCSVAYVAQKPWLLNATLRDNILFGQPFRARRYSRVVAACALQPDIAILPAGDLTHIGEKGIALSGGQRQRISVARALYSRASLVLMDDPLSALDAHVGQQLVEAGVRRLLLRRQGRTVVLVTHRLQLLTLAHLVLAMDNGSVRAQGTLAELERRDPGLVSQWRAAMSRQAEEGQQGARGRTARERWQLVRLVSRIGAQLRTRPVAPDGSWQAGDEPPMPPAMFVPFRRRTATSSLSRRHLSHDLPLPIDECGDDFVQLARAAAGGGELPSARFRGLHRGVFRAVSLQTSAGHRRCSRKGGSLPQLTRQMSTPSMQQNTTSNPRPRTFTVDGSRQGSFLRRLFSVSSQRSAPAAVPLESSAPTGRERNVLKRLISSSSTRSSVSIENDRPPVRRLASSTSAFSDDFNEDEEYVDEEGEVSCQLAGEEEREYGKVKRRVYLSYLRASGPWLGSAYLLTALAWQACRVLTDYWLSEWTSAATPDSPPAGGYSPGPGVQAIKQRETGHNDASYFLLVYTGLSGVSIVLSLTSNFLGQLAGARARRTLHEKALHSILRSPMRFFESTPVGRIINRFSADVAVIDKKIAISIQRLVQFLLLCVFAVGVNVVVSPWFALLALPTCLVYFWVQRFYRASARELQRLDSLTRSPIFSHFSETLGGLTTIRAFGQQERFTNMLHIKMDAHRNAFLIMNTGNRWLGIALDYLGAVIVFAAVVAALVSARLYPLQVTPSLVGLAVNYTLLVPIYLNWVVKFLADMEMYMTAVERVEQYARKAPENYREDQERAVPEEWPQEGHIKFEGVSLRYESHREPVISKLDLDIPAGQKVGICGRTGSGKSSLAMALFAMVEAYEGRVLVDGRDVLREVPLRTLRARLSAIPQDAIMFSGSLRDNLDPRKQFEDARLWEALEVAQVKGVASSLPGGLDGEVREGGENFSAGQRQLLCLARAALHGARCLVLDEATSSLDPATEHRLLAAAATAFAGRTVITIAHRLSTLLTCDRVIVLSAGRVVEDASPAQLLATPTSLFSEMLRASEEGSLL